MKPKSIWGIAVALIIIAGGIYFLEKPADIAGPASGPAVSTSADSFSMAQVASHDSASSCWTAISGGVYNLTSWISQHPGGAQAILSLCGTDGTAAFNAQHSGQAAPEQELASLKIGTLAQ